MPMNNWTPQTADSGASQSRCSFVAEGVFLNEKCIAHHDGALLSCFVLFLTFNLAVLNFLIRFSLSDESMSWSIYQSKVERKLTDIQRLL